MKQVYNLAEITLDPTYPRPPVINNRPYDEKEKPVTAYLRICSNGASSSISGKVSFNVFRDTRPSPGHAWVPGPMVHSVDMSTDNLWFGPPGVATPHSRWMPPEPTSREIELLRLKCIAKANSAGLDYLTMFAELRKTCVMLVDAIGAFRAYVRKIRRGADTKKDFGQKWLEYRYGWMPLVYDIEACLELLDDKYDQLFRVKVFSSFGSVPPVAFGSSGAAHASLLPPVTVDGINLPKQPPSWRWENSIQNPIGSLMSGAGVVSRMNGVSIQPLTTAWELVPWSFVIDWVINIGDIVRSFDIVGERDIKYCWANARSVWVSEYTMEPDPNQPQYYNLGDLLRYRIVTENSARQVSHGNMFKTRRSVLPTNGGFTLAVDLNLNWQRLVDSLFLADAWRRDMRKVLSFRR